MTDSNDSRTKEQLLAEIEALRQQLTARDSDASLPLSTGSSEPIFLAPMTRREALVGWIAPVVLSMTVVTAVVKPVTAYAATRAPTRVPTMASTTAPTAVPIPALGAVGLAALGGALAAAGAKLIKDRAGSDTDGSNSSGSGGDKGSK